MTNRPDLETTSPFPSISDMDLDMWRVSHSVTHDHARVIIGENGLRVCEVYGRQAVDADRDTTSRRIEMAGDLYEELRKLAERAKASGLDVEQAEMALSEFVAPRPFTNKEQGDD